MEGSLPLRLTNGRRPFSAGTGGRHRGATPALNVTSVPLGQCIYHYSACFSAPPPPSSNICLFLFLSSTSISLLTPPPPFITYTLFAPPPAPPLLCSSSGPRPSVSSPRLIHSCLWHPHISPSIHLLCLSRSPLAFPLLSSGGGAD